jgi:hypothetical protein
VPGLKIDALQDEIAQMRIQYDDYADPDPICGISDSFNDGRECLLTMVADKDMSPPILVHYELTNFHQNHRTYYQSRNDFQLNGGPNTDPVSRERCEPLNELGGIALNPAGMAANTFFNDVIKLVGGKDALGNDLVMMEDGIAWQSDIEYAFSQPDDFRMDPCPNDGACDESCCDDDEEGEWSCDKPYYVEAEDTCYRFFYPDDETTQYLWETYPDIISPLEGVTNEHFVVWMRIATQPTFRKLYGWINQPVLKGETLTFNVTANYVVTRFRGSKSILVSTTNIFGGRNPYLGSVFTYVGAYCLIAGTFFGAKQYLRPRKLADRNYLHFKSE